MAIQYCGSTKWTAVTAWAASTAYSVGALRRQLATPTAGNERVWRCTTAGTSGGSEPSWNLTAGATTNDGSAVWTEVTGLATYNNSAAWGAPHARIQNALAAGWMAAGDSLYVHENHAATRSAGSSTYTSPGTAASPCSIICVNDAQTARATTATETYTALTGTMAFNKFAYSYGVTYVAGNSTNNANISFGADGASSWWWHLEDCTLKLGGTDAANVFICSATSVGTERDGLLQLTNTKLHFSAAGQQFTVRGSLIWKNTSSPFPGTTPTNLFTTTSAQSAHANVYLEGVDLSALGSGKTIATISAGSCGKFTLVDCKLGSSVAITTGAIAGQGGIEVDVVNSDSADTHYRYHRQRYQGTESQETTVVRTSGASDGETSLARKIVTTANARLISPFESAPIDYWNTVTGSAITIAVPVVTDGVTLTDAEAWVEVEYLGTSGVPQGNYTHDRITDPIFGTPANQDTDSSSTWGGSLGSPVKQTLSVSITPQEAGLIRARVMIAKASTTLYYDPKILATSGRQYQAAAAFRNEGAGGLLLNPGMSGGMR